MTSVLLGVDRSVTTVPSLERPCWHVPYSSLCRVLAIDRSAFHALRAHGTRVFKMYAMEHDPITGAERYRNLQTGEISAEKPLSLGSERWDPEDMMLWTVEEVRLWRACLYQNIKLSAYV